MLSFLTYTNNNQDINIDNTMQIMLSMYCHIVNSILSN